MSDVQASQFLEHAADSDLPAAFYLLSERLSAPVLARICLENTSRPSQDVRLLGIGEIGGWLMGTRDVETSRLLATIVRKPQLSDATRRLAYNSSIASITDHGASTSLVLP